MNQSKTQPTSKFVRLSRYAGVLLSALGLASAVPSAQGGAPPQARPSVIQLERGRPFIGDVRDLPHTLPPQRERRPDRPEREDPLLPVQANHEDRAAQTASPSGAAPAPAPNNGTTGFAGLSFLPNGDGWPPDTNGDVGPNHYIQTVNTSIGIFDKATGTQIHAFTFDALMAQAFAPDHPCSNSNFGDPVVVWDSQADRWIITDFAFVLSNGNPVAPYYQCFAVSQTADPVSGGWYPYALQTTDLFPDYPKLGVWPDGLYLTASMFRTNTFSNVRVWALNRAQMEAGAPTSAVIFNLPSSVQGQTVFTGIPSTYHAVTGVPPAGRENLISVIWSAKVARIFKFHVDWANPANSTLTGPSNVTLATWGVGAATVPAKNGNALDTLRERLMVQNQYTNLNGAESLWLTHTVANPGNSALTSPRWYQLNVTGGTVVTSGPVQQSTWAPDSSVARFMPSLAVDKNGDMAIGYSASSSTLFPAIRYAGRLATDPPNTLAQTETSLIEGTASQCCNFSDGSANNRWGDYSAMTIDPDGCTFWYTTEYYESPQPTTLGGDNWRTRIGSFKFASCATTSPGTLSGSVTDSSTSSPIVGATVSAGGGSGITNGSGSYTFSVAPGTYTATASAAGYVAGGAQITVTSGAETVQNFALNPVVGPQATSLAATPASGPYGGSATFTATLSAGGAGVSGKIVAFQRQGVAVGNATTDASGVATVSGVSLSGLGVDSYPDGVYASFAGDSSFTASAGTAQLTVTKASQTISFAPIPDTTTNRSFGITVSTTSGLPASLTSTGACSLSAVSSGTNPTTATVNTSNKPGNCTITASQAGDANYNAAPNVSQSFNVRKR
jgi:hypothetical protein